jgi:dienelactone hydrolase
MTSHPPGPCCVSGRLLIGDARGKVKVINGTETYISSPSTNPNTSTAILFLSDACGLHIHSRLLADTISSAGNYIVVMPDLFHGDPHPYNDASVDLYEWLAGHPAERVDPVVKSTLEHIRGNLGFDRVGAVGYCFGAKYVIRWLGKPSGIDAGFVAHPSFVEKEELSSIKDPLSIAAAGESSFAFSMMDRKLMMMMCRIR